MLEQEIWKDIPGYEGYYQVSDLGRIKNVNGWSKRTILKSCKCPSGCLKVTLFKNGESKQYMIHNLVLLAFKGVFDVQIIHIDKNRENNKIDNLDYYFLKDRYKKNSFMSEKEIIDYYKTYKKDIKKICKYFSNRYKIDYTDLLSYADEVFFISCRKYIDKQVEFKRFFLYALYQSLLEKVQRYYKRLQRRQKILREIYFKENGCYCLKDNLNKSNLNDFVVKILDFCMREDKAIKKLKPYIRKGKYKPGKIYQYALIDYFVEVYHYTKKEIESGIKEIKYLLQNEGV